MVSWEYFSKRRGTSLAEFLVGITSYENALVHFANRNVSLPSDESLHDFYHKKPSSESKATEEKQAVVQKNNDDTASEADKSVEKNKKDWGIKTSKNTDKSK